MGRTILLKIFTNLARSENNFLDQNNYVEHLNVEDNVAKSLNILAT